MRLFNSFRLTILCFFVAGSFFACSGSGGFGGNPKGHLRFIHTITELPEIFIFVNDDEEPIRLSYGEVSEYQDYDDGDSIEIRLLVPSSPLPLVERNVTAEEDRDQTLVFFSDRKTSNLADYNVGTDLLTDQEDPDFDSRFLVRVVNAAPSLRSIDLYITENGDGLDQILPDQSSIGFRANTGYLEGNITRGVISLVDSKTRELLYQSESINFDNFPVVTVFALEQLGRGLPLDPVLSYDSE